MIEYSEETCITAGELRKLGINIPITIPDCGWIERGNMQMIPSGVKIEDNTVTLNCSVQFTQTFNWVELNFVAEKLL